MSRSEPHAEDISPQDASLTVSEFVALLNQAYDHIFPSVVITGELANFRVSKNRWVYFDLKDEQASVKFFGTVYQLPGPLEEGMLLQVRGTPHMHELYGFSVNVESIRPVGEGSLRRAAELLQAKLKAEGLFDPGRKRLLTYPPRRIGLITSARSAAYADFMKILGARWGGMDIELIDVLVQGEGAPPQLVAAIDHFNTAAQPPETLVIIRGGGSADDLAAFSHEQVTRAVAGSRVPTLIAIGHEIDLSLAELAADVRASTPSNAAELLTPDKRVVREQLASAATRLQAATQDVLLAAKQTLQDQAEFMRASVAELLAGKRQDVQSARQLLEALSPQAALKRGYAIIRDSRGKVLGAYASPVAVAEGDIVAIELLQARLQATVTQVTGLPRQSRKNEVTSTQS